MLVWSASAFNFLRIKWIELKLSVLTIGLDEFNANDAAASLKDELLDESGFVHGKKRERTKDGLGAVLPIPTLLFIPSVFRAPIEPANAVANRRGRLHDSMDWTTKAPPSGITRVVFLILDDDFHGKKRNRRARALDDNPLPSLPVCQPLGLSVFLMRSLLFDKSRQSLQIAFNITQRTMIACTHRTSEQRPRRMLENKMLAASNQGEAISFGQ